MDDPQKSSFHLQKAMEVAFEERDTSILEEYNRTIKHIALLRSEVELSEVDAPNLESYRNWAIRILTEIVERSNRNVPDSHLLSQIDKILRKERKEAYVENEEVVEVEIGHAISKTLETEWEQSISGSELPSGHRELIVSEVSKLKNGLKAILYQELLAELKGEGSRSTVDKIHLDLTVPELAIFARSIWESKALNKRRTTVIGLVRALSEIVELRTTGVSKISEDSLNHYTSGQWRVTRTNMDNVANMINDMIGWVTKESRGFKGGKLSNITK